MITENEYKQAKKVVIEYENRLKENKPRWKCLLCGRDKFTHKSPHVCQGRFRKRKIVWEQIG